MALGSFVMLYAAAASAQTTVAPTQPATQTSTSSKAAQTVTMTGCVGSLTGSTAGFVLSNPVVVPSSAQPGTPTASIETSAPSPSATPEPQPSGTAGAVAPGTSGTAGASNTSNAMNGYRLSGTDMSSWSGQRVQIVGVVVPATTGPAANAGAGGTGRTTGRTLPEFRVQTVQPITGSCPNP